MWYGSGTLNVAANGTTATGTGTQFIGNVRVGDGIAIQGSESLHEVTGVTSNTQLTFAPAFAGAAGSGKAFRIVPVLGYDKDLSDAFNQLRLQFGDQLSSLQPWATAPTLDAAHTAFGMSASGKAVATGTQAQARAAIDVPSATALKQTSPSILIVDQLRASVEAASGGKRTVLYNVDGTPSFMNIFTRYELEDLPGAPMGTGPHPAFIRNGVVKDAIMVGSFAACNVGGKAVSQPGVLPWRSINYDNALAACEANGPGWSMMSNLEWAAISLWCMANGFEPRGNTMSGKHHINRWETGRGGTPILSGSGPVSWSHDGTPSGIFDLVGNIWEWVTGLKLVGGRYWIAPDNGETAEGSLIDSGFNAHTADVDFSSLSNAGASDLVKQHLLAPAGAALAPIGRVYRNLEGERLPYRGGSWDLAGRAGLAALSLSHARASTRPYLGFRPAFAI